MKLSVYKIPKLTFYILLSVTLFITGCSNTDKGYYENGNLKFEIEKKSGKYNGKATFYYADGLKQHECFYSNDTLQGKSTRWYNNGKIYTTEHFKNNMLHGVVQAFDMNGKKVREENYHLDTLNGAYSEFYTSGQAKIQGHYRKGLYDGQWIYFEDDGTIIGMGDFDMGTGKQKAWYRNSSLKRETAYVDNEKHGKETQYNADGTVSKVLHYKYGELISTKESE